MAKYYQKNSRRIVIILITLAMAAVSIYVAITLAGRKNISLTNPANRPGAADPNCRLSLKLKSPSPTPTPVKTPTPQCNSKCATSANCPSGMTCSYGYCRNPNCLRAYNCVCPTKTPAYTPTPYKTRTPTPKPTDIRKPAVYLYPTIKTEVAVKVNVEGSITKSDPAYDGGWKVSAEPGGIINGKYDYLFYEASLNRVETPSEGWVVAQKDLNAWFDTNLPKLGLNTKETLQFKEYWIPTLTGSKYYEVRILAKSYLDKNLGLDISPRPDTVIRLNFIFKGTDNPAKLVNPTITTSPVRSGFTVVEWGGILDE